MWRGFDCCNGLLARWPLMVSVIPGQMRHGRGHQTRNAIKRREDEQDIIGAASANEGEITGRHELSLRIPQLALLADGPERRLSIRTGPRTLLGDAASDGSVPRKKAAVAVGARGVGDDRPYGLERRERQ